MLELDTLSEIINDALRGIEYPERPEGLYQPIAYILDCGGKRLRPVLTLATCQALCGNSDKALNQAMAMEMFHNFTLLHDDVMDKADLRRGRPTVHRKWDEATAILSGDALLTLATQRVTMNAGEYLNDVMDLFNKTAMEVYEGQQYDMDFEQQDDVTIEQYVEMIRLKTSVLLGAACEMGAIMGGASAEVRKAMYTFGEKLGLAFQLQDDYLDTYGDALIFGKEIGGDIVNNKRTWLLVTALSKDSSGKLHRFIDHCPVSNAEKIATVMEIYNDNDIPRLCTEAIKGYVDDAVAAVKTAGLSPSDEKFFIDLALSTIGRTH
ncbi:MAG: polyprenyl synthetase family protein [Bacteroidales bacterium]|nr:polyprenyl synthetase family protein [Bacteroidales bacterium]